MVRAPVYYCGPNKSAYHFSQAALTPLDKIIAASLGSTISAVVGMWSCTIYDTPADIKFSLRVVCPFDVVKSRMQAQVGPASASVLSSSATLMQTPRFNGTLVIAVLSLLLSFVLML